jgi:hypothetical protein
MTAPRLDACYFTGSHPLWRRLAAVLETSAQQHCPDWEIRVREIAPAPATSAIGHESHARNTQKLEHWCEIVSAATSGDRVLLIDADTFILRPLDHIWSRAFDLAYTTKRGAKFPFNGGVIFLRISDRVKAFVGDWAARNRGMLSDRVHHVRWRQRYGGINQGSLASLLAENTHGLAIQELPCLEWNCEDSAWAAFDPDVTRIVHVKSALRRAIFQTIRPSRPDKTLVPLIERWRALEAHALARSA